MTGQGREHRPDLLAVELARLPPVPDPDLLAGAMRDLAASCRDLAEWGGVFSRAAAGGTLSVSPATFGAVADALTRTASRVEAAGCAVVEALRVERSGAH